MTELILPGNREPVPESICIVNDKGREVEVPVTDLWMYGPDASTEQTTLVDISDLPKQEWLTQGDNDE